MTKFIPMEIGTPEVGELLTTKALAQADCLI
jgi:hypothetical protein